MRFSLPDIAARIATVRRTVVRTNVGRITAVISLAVMIIGSIVLWQYWVNIVKDAQARGETLAYLLAEQTTRTFQAVDLTLSGLEAVLQAAPLPAHAPDFESLLARRVSELRFIHALYVVNPSGRVTQSSGVTADVVSKRSARQYFEVFEQQPLRDVLIGQPLFSQPGMLSAIPVFRRLSTADGTLGGMIVASMDPKYFRDFYSLVDIGHGGSIDLYQNNGSILLASTGAETSALIPPVMPAPVFDADAPLGSIPAQPAATNERIVAYHPAENYPLTVAVGMDFRDIRFRWWRVAVPTLAAMAIAIIMGIALAVLVARRLEERRQAQARAMITQKLEALGQMTASVSHDFRNILAVMSATLQLMRKRGPTEKLLSAAEEAIERGSGLVTQLLAFSRRHALEVQPADINALLSGLLQVLGHAAGPNITLRIDKAARLPLCKADQTQFDAALMNLVVNARQAMPPKGGIVSISTGIVPDGVRAEPAFVELRVSDTGGGIAPDDLKRVFEPFFTTKAETGTGLGLSQVHGFMRQIGGDVTVSSVVGAGTTFSLLFPVVKLPTGAIPAPSSELSRAEMAPLFDAATTGPE